MKYENLLVTASAYPTFGEDMLGSLGESKGYRKLQMIRWAESGKVIRLKRGLYTLPEDKRKTHFSLRWLANTLCSPSYLSLEYMLSWYDMIPEKVSVLTSVSTLKTTSFKNLLGFFQYRHIKRELFWGFVEERDEFQFPLLVATPEKALLDYIYLYPHWEPSRKFMEENIRLQQLGQLQKKRLKEFSKKFSSKKISLATEGILGLL